MNTELEYTQIATLFPEITGEEFTELVEDIGANGLHDPIITLDSKILDGRNRYRACIEANVEPTFEEFKGTDPYAFVITKNLRRRHLKTGQRAFIASRLSNMKVGRNPDNGNQKAESGLLNKSIGQAAEDFHVGKTTIKEVNRVAKLDPELAERIGRGEITVNAALAELKERGMLEKKENAPVDNTVNKSYSGEDMDKILDTFVDMINENSTDPAMAIHKIKKLISEIKKNLRE